MPYRISATSPTILDPELRVLSRATCRALRRRNLLAFLALEVLLSAGTRSVNAAPADEAEKLVQEGISLRTEFRDLDALDRFQRAYQLAHTPRIEAQIGAAEQALGQWVDAEGHVSQALNSSNDPWINKNRDTLESALLTIRSHIGVLDILGGPVGAEILVDGRQVGRMPLLAPLHLPAGRSTIEVTAPEYFPVTRIVQLEARKFTRETIVLQMRPTDPFEKTGSAASVKEPNDTRSFNRDRSTPNAKDPSSLRHPLAWAMAGGSVVWVGVGIAELVVRNNRAIEYNRLAVLDGCTGDHASICASLHTSGDRARIVAIVGFSIAGGLAAASTFLFLTAPSPTSSPVAGLSCAGSLGILGATCRVTF